MASLALSPVSAAVYTVLNVAALTTLAPGGVRDYVPQKPTFPLVWFELQEEERRGLGTGGLPEVDLRVHCYSQALGGAEGQAVMQQVIELLKDQALIVPGYTQGGRVFYDRTVPLADELVNGVPVRELVAMFRIFVEEA